MMRRRRVEIFFVLYLTALVGFVVVSKERDKHDLRVDQQKENFLKAFLQPVEIEFPNDTLWWYVSSPSKDGELRVSAPLVADIKIHDIGPEDSVRLVVNSITYNNLLVSPKSVHPVGRRVFGDFSDRIVRYPVECRFKRTGTYVVTLAAKTNRIHFHDEHSYAYNGIVFPKEYISRELLEKIEDSRAQLTVIVEDTSAAKPILAPNLVLTPEKTVVTSALGFEEMNNLQVNLSFNKPVVRMVEGPGRLERQGSDGKVDSYIWRGPVRKYPYDVIVEARVARKAGGKDIARTRFTVEPVLPYLVESLPESVYSGEVLSMNVKVQGLDNDNLYSWKLFESAGRGPLITKFDGIGPKVFYRIPSGFTGKTLIVKAMYNGRPYLQYDAVSGKRTESSFSVPVVDAPVQIEGEFPQKLTVGEVYRFTAYRYSLIEYRYDQPVSGLDDVKVTLMRKNGKPVQTNVRMLAPGRFEFAVIYNDDIPSGGLKLDMKVHVNEASIEKSVILIK